jgi:uncharacterized repeat protein (TIGR03803 family)
MHKPKNSIVGVAIALSVFGWVFSLPCAAAQTQYQFQVLYEFGAPNDGDGPIGPLALDAKGNLFGATFLGGQYGEGTAFELTLGANGQWAETILHNFPDGQGDGESPSGIIAGGAGNLYGATSWGGAYGDGAMFELSPGNEGQWTESLIWSYCAQTLPCADGEGPIPPTLGSGGVLYSAAGNTAFELIPGTSGWTFDPLYTFCSLPNCADGTAPLALALDATGRLYGTAYGGLYNEECGAALGCGVVFVLQPQANGLWKETVLHDFTGGNDGYSPGGGVTLHDHALYGVTGAGGGNFCFGGCGTIFELTRSFSTSNGAREQIPHDFGPGGGVLPSGRVIFDNQGNMFGVTVEGGADNSGTVYEMTPGSNGKWTYQLLHSFNGSDGFLPNYGLTTDREGNLYGVTEGGGQYAGGVAFELSPPTQASK